MPAANHMFKFKPGDDGGLKRKSTEMAVKKAPVKIHGRRLPNLVSVRSESSPMAGSVNASKILAVSSTPPTYEMFSPITSV